MTDESIDLESSGREIESKRTRGGRKWRVSRRKRSLYKRLSHRLYEFLRERHVTRAALLLLLLAGFVHISFKHEVLAPKHDTPSSISMPHSMVKNDRLPGTANTDGSTQQPMSAWPTYDPGLSASAHDTASGIAGETAQSESGMPESNQSLGRVWKTTSYTVNEGGSLWRTAKRFIEDEGLLDKLIDNLERNGMDVRNVRVGVEFIVNDFGEAGRFVVVNDGENSYKSHIVDGNVTTSIQHRAENDRFKRAYDES